MAKTKNNQKVSITKQVLPSTSIEENNLPLSDDNIAEAITKESEPKISTVEEIVASVHNETNIESGNVVLNADAQRHLSEDSTPSTSGLLTEPHLTKDGKEDMRGGNRAEGYRGDLYTSSNYKKDKANQILGQSAKIHTQPNIIEVIEPTEISEVVEIVTVEPNIPEVNMDVKKVDHRGENQFTKDPEYHQRREENKIEAIKKNQILKQQETILPNIVTPNLIKGKPQFTPLTQIMKNVQNRQNTPTLVKIDGTADKRQDNTGNPEINKQNKIKKVINQPISVNANQVQPRLRGYQDNSHTIPVGYVPDRTEHVLENKLQSNDPAKCSRIHLATIIYLICGVEKFKQVKLDKNGWAMITLYDEKIENTIFNSPDWKYLKALGFNFEYKERIASYYIQNAKPEILLETDPKTISTLYDKIMMAAEASHKMNSKNNQFTAVGQQNSSFNLELNKVIMQYNNLIESNTEPTEPTEPESIEPTEELTQAIGVDVDTNSVEEEIIVE